MSQTMPITTDACRALLRKNAELAKWLADLGAKGSAAASGLLEGGTPPPEDFVHELTDACKEFAALRDEVLVAASTGGFRAPAPDTVSSTKQLEAVLGALLERLEAAERQAQVAQARSEALAVLERIGKLAHREDPGFAALALCQSKATEVRATLSGSKGTDPDKERAAAAEATAPFAALLMLMDGSQSFDDEQWGMLEDAVATAFGRPLAVAATRGKLQSR